MTWTGFATVFVAFFLTHSIPVRPSVKSRLVGILGARKFSLGYSVLSVGMLALLIWAAGQAPMSSFGRRWSGNGMWYIWGCSPSA